MSPPPGPPQADPADWRRDASFRWPDRVPWSQLAPQFHTAFGRADPADPQPEHIEFIGQNGSGKTHAAGKLYQERAFVTGRPSIIVAHKPLDRTLTKIGFPIVNTWDQLVKNVRDGYVNNIFWPRTRLMGSARASWYDGQMTNVMDHIWASSTPKSPADTDIVLDDAGYIEEELGQTFARLKQFLREGRSPGFSVGLLKQRPQGGTRLASSETQWTAGFRPKDDSDLERWAELFGSRRDWMPVFRTLDRQKREFVIKHTVSQDAYITWIDEPLAPREPPRRRRKLADFIRW
jgi:hypothetical protein